MSRAESEADSNKDDVAHAKKRIAARLNDHTGPENAVSSQELADYVGLSASTVRDCIVEIRREYGVPVVSRNKGYYVIESREEFERQLDRYSERVETIEERRRELAAAWNQHKSGEEA